MDQQVKDLMQKGRGWATKTLEDKLFFAANRKLTGQQYTPSRLAKLSEDLIETFARAYAMENGFNLVVDTQGKGLDRKSQQAIVTYEASQGILGRLSGMGTGKRGGSMKALSMNGVAAHQHLLEEFLKNYHTFLDDGIIRNDQEAVNYTLEHFDGTKQGSRAFLPHYTLKEDLFGSRAAQGVAVEQGQESSVKPLVTSHTFADVVGMDEQKREVNRTIIGILKDYDGWKALQEKPEKTNVRFNAMFYGPPGTGKTYFAKALAGEINAPFYMANGSDFVKKYLGEGKDLLVELYRAAEEGGRGVVYIDEADVIGASRDSDEAKHKRDVINCWLSLLDDSSRKGVVVTIISTNRWDDFDKALLDRFPGYNQLLFEPLSPEMRAKILEYHLGLYKHEPIDLPDLAKLSSKVHASSLRSLPDIVAYSSFCAKERGNKAIQRKDVEQAIEWYAARMKVER